MMHILTGLTEQFVEFYYKTFDQDRTQLAPLYVSLPPRSPNE